MLQIVSKKTEGFRNKEKDSEKRGKNRKKEKKRNRKKMQYNQRKSQNKLLYCESGGIGRRTGFRFQLW